MWLLITKRTRPRHSPTEDRRKRRALSWEYVEWTAMATPLRPRPAGHSPLSGAGSGLPTFTAGPKRQIRCDTVGACVQNNDDTASGSRQSGAQTNCAVKDGSRGPRTLQFQWARMEPLAAWYGHFAPATR